MTDLAAMYSAHVSHLRNAYATAVQDAGFEALVVHSGRPQPQSRFDDQYWPFKPSPAFAHWVPLREPDSAVLLSAGDTPVLVRTVVDDFWEGTARTDADHVWSSFDVREVSDPSAIADLLPRGRVAFVGDDVDRARSWGIGDDAINPVELIAALDRTRTRKTGYELHCMAEANRRATRGHAALARAFRQGERCELALHLAYLDATGQDDADTPYKNIVAVGRHGAVLHHVHYDTRAPSDAAPSLLVDAGATHLGYASDVTRTTVVGDSGDGATFAELVRRMDELQQRITAQVEVGVEFEALHDRAHEMLATVLREVGIGRGSADELVAGGVTRAFLPHGLGHSIGVQVHDVGCRVRPPRPENPFLRNTSRIEPGQVFTIEPGCYFIDGLLAPVRSGRHADAVDWGLVDRLRRFGGVRIEDNVAVVEDGTRNLTRDNWPEQH